MWWLAGVQKDAYSEVLLPGEEQQWGTVTLQTANSAWQNMSEKKRMNLWDTNQYFL